MLEQFLYIAYVVRIPVEHDIGSGRETALKQVHQQERKVVEDVTGRDDVAELDGIEKNGPAVDQDNITEMQIAMDAADETLPPAQRYARN